MMGTLVVKGLKTSRIRSACCSSQTPSSDRSQLTYGMIISSSNLTDPSVILKCFGFTVKLNDLGKLNFVKLCWVFPSYISRIGRNSFENVMPNVGYRLLVRWSSNTNVFGVFFSTKVYLEVGACLEGVSSIFNISECGIWYFSILEMISWWKISAVSFRAPSGISGLLVVAALSWFPFAGKDS